MKLERSSIVLASRVKMDLFLMIFSILVGMFLARAIVSSCRVPKPWLEIIVPCRHVEGKLAEPHHNQRCCIQTPTSTIVVTFRGDILLILLCGVGKFFVSGAAVCR